jgi:hypothetical protein
MVDAICLKVELARRYLHMIDRSMLFLGPGSIAVWTKPYSSR